MKNAHANRGQILSLDLVIALSIAFLSIGTLLAWHELAALNAKESELQNALSLTALNAANALASLDGWTCASNASDDASTFPACIVDQHASSEKITKGMLGIPKEYNYQIIGLETDDDLAYNAFTDSERNVVDQNVNVLYIGATDSIFTIEGLETCMKKGIANCPWKTKSISIRVWRN